MRWFGGRLWIVFSLMIAALFSTGPLCSQSSVPHRESGIIGRAELTLECRQSIEKGTKFLLAAISHSGVPLDPEHPADLSCTSIVGLALLSQGTSLSGGPHVRELRRVLEAVLTRIDELPATNTSRLSLSLVQRKIGAQADLFLSALFLSQILSDPGVYSIEVRRSLEKIVNLIARSQQPDGTWGDESWAPVLGTVLGWESLRAASSCGLQIDASAQLAGEALLKKLNKLNNGEKDWMQSLYKEASAVRVLGSLGLQHEPSFQACVTRILKIAKTDERPFTFAGGEEFLAFYLATECLIHNPQESWRPWYPTVRDRLIRIQNRDGSWTGHHCITSRTFCTAAALLTLQAPNNVLPVSDL